MDQLPTEKRLNEGRRQWFRALAATAAGSAVATMMPAETASRAAELPLAARGQTLTEHQQKYYRTARML